MERAWITYGARMEHVVVYKNKKMMLNNDEYIYKLYGAHMERSNKNL